MAVYSKDGVGHHSAGRARMHESRMGESAAKPKGAMPKQDGAEEKPAHDEASSESIEDVVKAHGPAHHVEIHKDEATGKHHVHSKHGEHDHHSEHDSAEEALDHAGKAMGAESDEPEDEKLGEEMAPEMEEEESHSRIPGL